MPQCILMTEYEITVKPAYAMVENKRVSLSGNSGRAIVPRGWVGKRVTVILTEPLEEEAKRSE